MNIGKNEFETTLIFLWIKDGSTGAQVCVEKGFSYKKVKP